MTYVILGCGYTGRRVAAALVAAGEDVVVTNRSVRPLPGARAVAAAGWSAELPSGATVLHSIPPHPGSAALARALGEHAARVVYLSSTGVYGEAAAVDETTPAHPVAERQRARRAAEEELEAAVGNLLILRAAAIYGPGRGVHAALRAGRYRLAGDGRNITSRIHVDDLATLAVAGLRGDITGAYPVADDGPAPAVDVARFAAAALGLVAPESAPIERLHETLRFTRRVDGRAIRAVLGVALRYPDYRVGIPAALAAE